jgi:hypothetical protein
MRARVAERAIPLGKLLRQKPVLGGEAVGPLLKSLPTGPGWRFFRSLSGRWLRRGGGSRCRPPRSESRGARGRRLTFLASDVGESLVELAGKPGLDALGNRISPGFGNQPQSFAPVEQGPTPIDGGLRAGAKRGVRRDEAGGLTLPSAPPAIFGHCHGRLFDEYSATAP